jgi:hypothetical protein
VVVVEMVPALFSSFSRAKTTIWE